MAEIKSTNGYTILVDDEDLDVLRGIRWSAIGRKTDSLRYAISTTQTDGVKKTLSMHRLIAGAKKGDVVDHINHNGLDNRKCNLRICVARQNRYHSRKSKDNISGYKGVHLEDGAWRVRIIADGKTKRVGRFSSKIIAAYHYDNAARKLHGEFAVTNFPAPMPVAIIAALLPIAKK